MINYVKKNSNSDFTIKWTAICLNFLLATEENIIKSISRKTFVLFGKILYAPPQLVDALPGGNSDNVQVNARYKLCKNPQLSTPERVYVCVCWVPKYSRIFRHAPTNLLCKAYRGRPSFAPRYTGWRSLRRPSADRWVLLFQVATEVVLSPQKVTTITVCVCVSWSSQFLFIKLSIWQPHTTI